MDIDLILVFCAFSILLTISLLCKQKKTDIFSRTKNQWIVDGVSLLNQGYLVPFLQKIIAGLIIAYFFAGSSKFLSLNPLILFLLHFTLIDYLYYWNHRIFHKKQFWWLHSVHHSSPKMDILMTSKNSLWTPFFIVYIWIHAFFLSIIANPTPYLIGLATSACLDLWRHSGFNVNLNSNNSIQYLWWLLITPNDHSWHHSSNKYDVNFGANLTLWDRMHGTFFRAIDKTPKIGTKTKLNLFKTLFFPIESKDKT